MIKRIAKTVNIKQKFKDTIEAVKTAARIADEKKADYIKILDMRSRLVITDYFIIISAKNTRLTRRIEEEIRVHLKSNNLYPINVSGLAEGNWILIDYDDFVIHIFTDQFKEYYQLEKLWRDSKEIKWN
ncbi:MAG TPA: ribosome silencing factor [Candidatus Hydromicrobium sp.]